MNISPNTTFHIQRFSILFAKLALAKFACKSSSLSFDEDFLSSHLLLQSLLATSCLLLVLSSVKWLLPHFFLIR
jgi:hypothetical protein